MVKLVGTGRNQVPTNNMLGNMAFQNKEGASIDLLGLAAGTAAAPSLIPTGDPNTGMWFPAADTIAFSEGGAEAMRIDSSGNVNIGQTTASGRLNVRGGLVTIYATSLGTANTDASLYLAGSGGSTFSIQQPFGSAGLFFYDATNAAERMRISATGNVGIGTTSPGHLLQVNSTGTAISATTSSTTTQFSGPGLRLYNTNASMGTQAGLGIASLISDVSATQGYMAFFQTNNSGGFVRDILRYDYNASLWQFYTNATEKLRIDTNGNVGIGTTVLTNKLNLFTNAAVSVGVNVANSLATWEAGVSASGIYTFYSNNAFAITFSNNATERMRIRSDGNVGIGTTAPDALLSVNGIASFGAGAAATPSIAGFGDLNTGMWFPAADTIAWSTGGTERLRIASGGTVSTTGTLTIAGGAASISSTSFDFTSSTTFAPQIVLVNTANDAFAPFWNTRKLRGAAAANSGDQLGTFVFQSADTGGTVRNAATFSAVSEGAGATFHSAYYSFSLINTAGTFVIPLQVKSQGLLTVDGTALLPSFTFANDPDTGFWRPAANTLAASTNATERMRIRSDGNVGIGTTAPDAMLSVNGVASFGDGTAAAPSITNLGDLNTGMWFPAADTIAWSTGGSERMRVHSSGGVSIGNTTDPGVGALIVNSTIQGTQLRGGYNNTTGVANTVDQALGTNTISMVLISANTTLTSTVPPAGAHASVIIKTSGVTSRTVTFGTGFKSVGTLATGATADRFWVVNFVSDGTFLYESSRTTAAYA